MLFAHALLGQELILLSDIGLALGVIYGYLRWRSHLDLLRHVWPPALLWTVCGTLDALVTLVGTWDDPTREANPILRAWLIQDGWVGQLLYTFVYILLWAAVVLALEALRRRVRGVWVFLLGAAQLIILYALALGHLVGFLSWTPAYRQVIVPLMAVLDAHAPWLESDSLTGYFTNLTLVLGAACTAVQLAIAVLLRWTGVQARTAQPRPSPREGAASGQAGTGLTGKAGSTR